MNNKIPELMRFEAGGPADTGLTEWEPIDPSSLDEGKPVQHGHIYHEDPQLGYLAGVWHCTPMTEKFGPYAMHEFMFLLEGSVTMICADGHETTVKAGEAFILPKGLACQWKQTDSVRKYFMIFENPGIATDSSANELGVIVPQPLGPAGGMTEQDVTDTCNFLSEIPTQKNHVYFKDPSDQMTCGVWQSTPFETTPARVERNELMYILQGTVTLTDSNNVEHLFKAGDAAYVPKGAVMGWKSTENVRKFYSIFEPRR